MNRAERSAPFPGDLATAAPRRPLVSIGVPVYNGERLLARTLESLLGQSYTELEIIVSDNASTDRTEAIARDFAARDPRIRYVRNDTNIGAVPNFLATLALAAGTYFTWTAADDVRPSGAIEACVAALEAQPDAVMAHGPIELELPGQSGSCVIGNRADIRSSRPSTRVKAFTTEIVHVGLMFGLHRRRVLTSIHYGLHVAGDYFVCLQLSQRGPIVWVPTPILIYRHQYGAIDNPMYARTRVTVRDLLLHRGLRRKKCWMVLGIGSYYLWREGARHGLPERLRTMFAFITGFSARFRPHLASEAVFLLFSPASWIAASVAPTGRRLKRHLRPMPSMPLR